MEFVESLARVAQGLYGSGSEPLPPRTVVACDDQGLLTVTAISHAVFPEGALPSGLAEELLRRNAEVGRGAWHMLTGNRDGALLAFACTIGADGLDPSQWDALCNDVSKEADRLDARLRSRGVPTPAGAPLEKTCRNPLRFDGKSRQTGGDDAAC